ncbi:MAG TPA: urease accessory UreF family protein [Burkholderiales bacterium]|nr:urease accessory UreF family protein [Burkholderiales bacterium]
MQNLLGALQFADSFFPSGSIAFSWGLETLRADAEVGSPAEIAQFLEGQLLHRWAVFDAPLVIAATRSAGKFERLAELDELAEAMTLASELREGSRRAGASLLKVHEGLGTTGAAEYRQEVMQRRARGHLAVMQGMLWTATGLSEDDCRAVSAHTLCTGIVGAALRLGMIGHLDAQKILLQVRPALLELLELPTPPAGEICSYTPHAEIAAMRHEVQDSRLFAN